MVDEIEAEVLAAALRQKQRALDQRDRELEILAEAAKNLTHATGPEGKAGKDGKDGAQGERGLAGPRGVLGPVGPEGIPGVDGQHGVDGAQGIPGERGEIGPVGPSGSRGERGLDGAQGDGFRWRGQWTKGVVYSPLDVVQFEGSSWVATSETSAKPGSGPGWDILARKGEDGGFSSVGATEEGVSAASEVSVEPTGDIDSENVQDALEELQGDIDDVESDLLDLAGDVSTLEASSHDPVTIGTFGATPTAKGLSLSGQVVTLQPASAAHPGAMSAADKTAVDAIATTVATAVSNHAAASDPHTGYQKESEKDQASGYAGLSAGSKLTGSQQTYGVAANTAVEGNDARVALAWHGKVSAAYCDGDPNFLMALLQRGTVGGTTPTNFGTVTARCAGFTLPAALTVNKIRFYGIGSTTDIYKVALYRFSDLARLTAELSLTTAANTWGSVGNNLGVTLAANTPYFIACSVNNTGATAGVQSTGTSVNSTSGEIITAPQSLPGNLDFDLGFFSGLLFQFTVTAGALPDPAATPAAQSAWSGGMPAFWLDNNNA